MSQMKITEHIEISSPLRGWEIIKLGNILTLEYGKGLPERERTEGIYPVIGSNGIVGFHSQALIKGPGIVIGRKGTIGAVSLINTDFWPIDTTYYIKVLKKEIDLKWLFFALVKLNLPRLSLADVVPGLKRELVYALQLLIPPLPEQKKIAEILSTVDKAIEKVDEAIEKTQRLKKGLMQELLTGRRNTLAPDPVGDRQGRREFKQTEIGRIPREWQISKLGDITKVTVGYVGQISKSYTNKSNGIPLLSTTNISENGIKLEDLKYVSPEFHYRNKKSRIFPRDIIIARHGISGSAAAIPEVLKEAQCLNVVIVRHSAKFESNFIEYLFNFKLIRERLSGWKSGSVQGVVNTKILEKFKLPIPPLHEQKKISEILSTVDKRLELLRKKKEKLERVKKGLMNDLLSGSKRVKSLISKEA